MPHHALQRRPDGSVTTQPHHAEDRRPGKVTCALRKHKTVMPVLACVAGLLLTGCQAATPSTHRAESGGALAVGGSNGTYCLPLGKTNEITYGFDTATNRLFAIECGVRG